MENVTVKDIAKKLNISVGTVYRSLNNTGRVTAKTRMRVLECAQEMNFRPNAVAQGLAKRKRFRIVVLLSNDVPEWWASIKIGVDKAAAELSQFGVETILLYYSALDINNTPIGLYEMVKNGQADGVILAPSVHREVLQTIDLANTMKIPIVCINADAQQEDNRLFYYGPDEEKAGNLAGDLLGKFIRSKGNIYLVGLETNDFYRLALRKRGILNQISRYFPDINILGSYSFPKENYRDAVDKLITSHASSLSGIYAYEALALADTANVLKTHNYHHIALVGHECLALCEKLIEEGWITSSICQETISQGYYPMKLLYQYLLTQKQVQSRYYSNVNIVIRGNLELLQKNENGCGFQ